jgi:hypothetical protein
MKKYVLSVLSLVLLFLAGSGLIGANAAEKSLTGKDLVRLGKAGTVSGSLLEKGGEWYLQTKTEVFNLHFGNHDYRARTGIRLATGKSAVVKGFIHGKEVAVSAITVDRKNYQFRRANGAPLWAGNGNNRNRH